MNYYINNWKLVTTENLLIHKKHKVKLQPLCMKLLMYLISREGQTVNREDMITFVWGGRVVSEDAINNCVKKLRQSIGDNSKQPQMIQTIKGEGYRLIAKVKSKAESRPWFHNKLNKTLFIFCSLFFSTLWLPIEIDIITIDKKMSEQEKMHQYDRIKQKTINGGHLVKIEVGD